MITDGIQAMIANTLLPQLGPVRRQRIVEALTAIARDSADAGGSPGQATRPHEETRFPAPTPSRESLHFVYRAVRENGRRVAKRSPQVTDTRYWSFMLDRAG